MDAATIGMVASLATTLIIAVTAFAALRQIRHNRIANELQIFLHFVDEVNAPKMVDALAQVQTFGKNMKDPSFRAAVLRDPDASRSQFRALIQFFERYASLVIVSGLSERLLFFEYSSMFISVWDSVHEIVRATNNPQNPYAGRAFEHLAMRAKHYLADSLPREYAQLERDPRMLATNAD